jgi:hypothetical protein
LAPWTDRCRHEKDHNFIDCYVNCFIANHGRSIGCIIGVDSGIVGIAIVSPYLILHVRWI